MYMSIQSKMKEVQVNKKGESTDEEIEIVE